MASFLSRFQAFASLRIVGRSADAVCIGQTVLGVYFSNRCVPRRPSSASFVLRFWSRRPRCAAGAGPAVLQVVPDAPSKMCSCPHNSMISGAAEHGPKRSLNRQSARVQEIEVSITQEKRAESVSVVYNLMTPSHACSGISGLIE